MVAPVANYPSTAERTRFFDIDVPKDKPYVEPKEQVEEDDQPLVSIYADLCLTE